MIMQMQMQHQKHRMLGTGQKVLVGEDGYPYASDGIIIVADGLGGRGGYPHTKLNPDALDRDKFFGVAFGKAFDDADEAYREFVLKSFRELFELKDVYQKEPNGKRTSGYFASRLVTAIALYELRFDPQFAKDKLFAALREKTEEEAAAYAAEIGKNLAAELEKKLRRVAERMGLELESKTKGSYLLPSTLVIALVDEHETDCDVLYLWAGDSRGYLWDANGLGQITEDHERDETMFNLVTLTKPFTLEGRLVKVPKPVLLFNATDGCYKCQCFASPIDLEYVFLDSLKNADGFNGAAEALDKCFGDIGNHDDSNTMGLLAYGFADYAAVKEAIDARLAKIDSDYVAELPGILEQDYSGEREMLEGQLEGAVYAVRDKLIEREEVCDFVKDAIRQGHFAPYNEELETLSTRENGCIADIKELEKLVKDKVTYHWLRDPYFIQIPIEGGPSKPDREITKAKSLESKVNEIRGNIIGETKLNLEILETSVRDVLAKKELLLDIDKAAEGDPALEVVSKALKSALSAAQKLGSIAATGNRKDYKLYKKALEEFNSFNEKNVKTPAAEKAIAVLTRKLCTEDGFFETISMPSGLRIYLSDKIGRYREKKKTLKMVTDEIGGLPEKYCIRFWEAETAKLIADFAAAHKEILTDEELGTKVGKIAELYAQYAEADKNYKLRERLYAKYEEIYKRLYKETTL